MIPRCLVVCALLLAPSFPVSAQSSPNMVRFGRNLSLGTEQRVHNISCFLCSASIEGSPTGNVRVFAGNVFLNGSIGGHILVFGGNVTLTGKAAVGDGVIIVGGHLNQDPAATIQSRTVLAPIIFLPVILVLCAAFGSLIVLTRRMVRGPVAYPRLPRL